MNINSFLDFFDFTLEKYEDGYGVIDLQGANLCGIEEERFDTLSGIIDRFADSIYIPDYIDTFLEEDGYDGDCDYESQYEWCVNNNHWLKDMIYVFLHPETITME